MYLSMFVLKESPGFCLMSHISRSDKYQITVILHVNQAICEGKYSKKKGIVPYQYSKDKRELWKHWCFHNKAITVLDLENTRERDQLRSSHLSSRPVELQLPQKPTLSPAPECGRMSATVSVGLAAPEETQQDVLCLPGVSCAGRGSISLSQEGKSVLHITVSRVRCSLC